MTVTLEDRVLMLPVAVVLRARSFTSLVGLAEAALAVGLVDNPVVAEEVRSACEGVREQMGASVLETLRAYRMMDGEAP